MMASIKGKAAGLLFGGLTLVSAWLYWLHVTNERDAYRAEAERQATRVEILQEHQQWQRQQIKTLNDALAERDRALTIIADDIRASTAALQQLGETDAEAREWLDGDRPSVITDWVRELQRSSSVEPMRLPDGAQTPND